MTGLPDEAPTRRFDAVVFDFDGLIIETEAPQAEAWQLVFREHGVEMPLSIWADKAGRPGHTFDIEGELERAMGRSIDRAAVKQRQLEHCYTLLDQAPVLPGVETWITGARQAGLSVGLASGSHRGWIDHHLSKHDLIHHFDVIVTVEDTDLHKPHPDPFLAACRALGAAPERCIALEDSEAGVASARAAGMYVIAVPTAITRHRDLSPAHAIVETLAALPLASVLAQA